MQILAFLLLGIGLILALIYGIILMVKAFQASVWWGLGYLFVPFVALIFVFTHWEVAKKPFLMNLLAIALMIAGLMLLPEEMRQTM
jgi:uncharacterized membrane protein